MEIQKPLPNTLNVGFQGLSAETLISLDLDGVAVSTDGLLFGGTEPSPVPL